MGEFQQAALAKTLMTRKTRQAYENMMERKRNRKKSDLHLQSKRLQREDPAVKAQRLQHNIKRNKKKMFRKLKRTQGGYWKDGKWVGDQDKKPGRGRSGSRGGSRGRRGRGRGKR